MIVLDANGNPASDRSESKSLETWVMRGAGGAAVIRYPANLANGTALITGSPAINVLHAYHWTCPADGTLDGIGFRLTANGAAGSRASVGIYSAKSRTNLYPDALLYDSGAIVTDAGAPAFMDQDPALVVEKGRLYWFVYFAGTAAPQATCAAIPACRMDILGMASTLGALPTVGLSSALAFGALPANFPAGATRITAVPVPVISVTYAA